MSSSASLTHSILPACGIDVGFFSTKFSLGTRKGPEGSEIFVDQFPSLSSRISADFRSLPTAAKHDGAYVTVEGVSYFVGKSVLQMMGAAGGIRASYADYSESATYHALLLGAFHYISMHYKSTGSLTIKQLVLGLPLSTVNTHAEKLESLAKGEHIIPSADGTGTIKVTIQNVTVVCQPQGALMNYAYKLGQKATNEKVLVLDLGGGTFDWFLCDSMRPNYLKSGAAPIGALACVTAACDLLNPRFKSDPDVLNKVDLALRNKSESVRIAGIDHPLEKLWPTVHSVIKDGLEQMVKQVGSLDSVDSILLTGGGAKLLEQSAITFLADYKSMFVIEDNPVSSNVCGYHLLAQMLGE